MSRSYPALRFVPLSAGMRRCEISRNKRREGVPWPDRPDGLPTPATLISWPAASAPSPRAALLIMAASAHPADQSALALPNRKLPANMTVNNKRVFYVKYLAHEIYIDILKARADVRLDRLENESPGCGRGADPGGGACLSDRRGARRDRPAFPCPRGPAEAGAEPADRVLERRGLRSRRRRCLHGGGRARRQSVRRQRQFGRRARARHDADAVQAHPRGRPRAAPRGQCQPQRADRQRGAGQDRRHRRDRQCRPPHRRAVQGPAAHEGDRLRSLSDGGRNRGARRARRSNCTI